MPLFGLSPQQRESVITFVLGLVAEPPAYEFVYHPDERKQALIAGRRVLEKYNCTGCHMVEPEKWTIEFPSGEFGPQASNPRINLSLHEDAISQRSGRGVSGGRSDGWHGPRDVARDAHADAGRSADDLR